MPDANELGGLALDSLRFSAKPSDFPPPLMAPTGRTTAEGVEAFAESAEKILAAILERESVQ